MTNFSLTDLEQAKADLAACNKRFDDYSGNNPNKYQADVRSARERVRVIESALKESGTLPKTEYEKLESELDRLFPNARSKRSSITKAKGINAASRRSNDPGRGNR